MTDEVGALDAEVAQQGMAVGGVLRHRHGATRVGAARVPATVVADQVVAIGQGRFGEQRPKRLRDERPVDERHGLAVARNLVFEREAIEVSSFHVRTPFVRVHSHGGLPVILERREVGTLPMTQDVHTFLS